MHKESFEVALKSLPSQTQSGTIYEYQKKLLFMHRMFGSERIHFSEYVDSWFNKREGILIG